MSDRINRKEIFLLYEQSLLSNDQEQQLRRLVDPELLSILLKYGVIAGGAALSVFCPRAIAEDVDVFVLNSNRDALTALLHELHDHVTKSGCVYMWSIQGSVIELRGADIPKIQIVFDFNKTVEELLTSFDMDYIQCAICNMNNQITAVRSNICKLAHDAMKVNYVGPTRLYRLKKAEQKGFAIPLHYSVLLSPSPPVRNTVDFVEVSFENLMKQIASLKPLLKRIHYDKIDPVTGEEIELPYCFAACEFVYHSTPTPEAQRRLDAMLNSDDPTDVKIATYLKEGSFRSALIEAYITSTKGNSFVPALVSKANRKSLDDILDLIRRIQLFKLESIFKPYYGPPDASDKVKIRVENNPAIEVPIDLLKKVKYFEKLLSSGMKETSSGVIDMTDVSYTSLQHLLTYAAAPYHKTLSRLSYIELCSLHHLCDRFFYNECAACCFDLMICHLNDATALELIWYLSSVHCGYELFQLQEQLNNYVRSSVRFRTELIGSLDNDDIYFILNRCSLEPSKKLLLRLCWIHSQEKADYSSIVLPESVSELGTDGDEIIKVIQSSKNVELLSSALTLLSSKALSKSRVPSGLFVIRPESFDFSLLSLGPLTEHRAPVLHGGYHGGIFKRIIILYDNRDDWSIALPDVPFFGVKMDRLTMDRYDATCLLRYVERDKNQTLLAFMERFYEWLLTAIPHVPGIRSALGQSNITSDRLRQCVTPLIKHMIDRVVGEIIPHSDSYLYLRVNPGRVALKDTFTGQDLTEPDVRSDYVAPFDPYILSSGVMQIRNLYFGGGKCSPQKYLISGYIQQPQFKAKTSHFTRGPTLSQASQSGGSLDPIDVPQIPHLPVPLPVPQPVRLP